MKKVKIMKKQRNFLKIPEIPKKPCSLSPPLE